MKKLLLLFFFIKQKTAYEMRISDWSSDVCSSDLGAVNSVPAAGEARSNMHVGGRPEKIGLTQREREICEIIGPHLKREGLIFVGIDETGRASCRARVCQSV